VASCLQQLTLTPHTTRTAFAGVERLRRDWRPRKSQPTFDVRPRGSGNRDEPRHERPEADSTTPTRIGVPPAIPLRYRFVCPKVRVAWQCSNIAKDFVDRVLKHDGVRQLSGPSRRLAQPNPHLRELSMPDPCGNKVLLNAGGIGPIGRSRQEVPVNRKHMEVFQIVLILTSTAGCSFSPGPPGGQSSTTGPSPARRRPTEG
jgi:hypothetical protein